MPQSRGVHGSDEAGFSPAAAYQSIWFLGMMSDSDFHRNGVYCFMPEIARAILNFVEQLWPAIAALLTFALSVMSSGHAILNKRDSRAAVGWVGLIWFVPVIGAGLYLLLGVNRINRRAKARFRDRLRLKQSSFLPIRELTAATDSLAVYQGPLRDLSVMLDRVSGRPLLEGNAVVPLLNGDEAYPAMLDAIAQARKSITLTSYIFDNDAVGVRFADALRDAVERGVEVRVIIDDVGARYTFPSITKRLLRSGVPVVRFLPTVLPWRFPYFNLRSHRKILVVDGSLGFTGGMNIRAGHVLGDHPKHPVEDIHFRLEGPVVGHLQEVFVFDWGYITGEVLEGPLWFPELVPVGTVAARGISDGPDDEFDRLRWTLLGAVGCARKSIRIATPYFLPEPSLITALNVAALRGIQVDIILPAANNLVMVKWASDALLWQLLSNGCRIHMTEAPFDHSKMFTVDDDWALIGSGNWDPRTLRLNFEFNVECYDEELVAELHAVMDRKMLRAREVTLHEMQTKSLPVRLRNGIAFLFMPYL